MSLYPFEFQANLIQLAVSVVMTTWFTLCQKGKSNIVNKLFFWGLFSYVLMSVYWTCMIWVDGSGNYATFTACDTATIAWFLFFTAMFYCEKTEKQKMSWVYLLEPCFGIWNVVWWTLWTGNLLINILWGGAIGMLSYKIARTLLEKKCVTRDVRLVWIVLTAVLVVFEIPMYLYERSSILYRASDWICAGAWLLFVLFYFIKAVTQKRNRTLWFLAALLYALYAQYLSDGIRYSIFVLVETLVLFFLIFFFNKQEFQGEGDT